MLEQGSLFTDNPEYDAFVEKFKPKKTTDDCYTPPIVYDAVAGWVAQEYGLDRSKFVRPFYPGGDYQAEEYAPDAVVVDNPPFSIFAQIVRWYQGRGIKFFLFGPALTLFSAANVRGVCYMLIGAGVTYENSAVVGTSFATNLDEYRIRTAPDLYQRIKVANEENQKQGKKELPRYAYPDHIITAALAQKWCHYGVDLRIRESECVKVSYLDEQKAHGKSIFGGGFLLSERAAAERAAAERAAAHKWSLSDREREIVRRLSEAEAEGAQCTPHIP